MTVSILRTADAWWVQTPTGAARITTAAATTRQLLADRAAIEAADRSTDTVPVDSLQLLDRSAMRGTIAMRIPVWPLIRRAAKLGSRLEGELVLEQQDPEHPRGPDALEDRHCSHNPADRPVERKQ